MSNQTDNNLIDRIGIWTSGLCAVHCLALPVLLPIMPIIGASVFAQDWFERTILSLSMLIGFWALFVGFFKYHRQLYPVYSLALGGLVYWNKDIFGEAYEPFTIAAGAFLIIAAHVMNIRLCQSCHGCNEACQSA
ncbi:MerC domain-containing protein [Aestuariibacter salexigens]|uniref:MerC domain-containing protein n=1 Tax=Aestuariibacter salexigens TaxID=226010 RepID=UPI000414D93E|nr:MerC domain-containing protein [Aestuariibacter salexigens]